MLAVSSIYLPIYVQTGILFFSIPIALSLVEPTIHKEDKTEERGKDGPDPKRPPSAADDPVHLLEFPLGGTVIEISHPTTTESGTARLVASRAPLGAVYHHTAPFTPDVYRFVEQAVPAGMEQIGTLPPKGSKKPGSSDLAWFHPRSCLGMLLEPWNRLPGGDHYRE